MPEIVGREVVFSTPWFDIVAKTTSDGDPTRPYYSVRTDDYVTVVAVTADHRVILVRQYRPAVERETLELPAGHVENGESPVDAARRELAEETGYDATAITHLGTLLPDTGRLGNRMWCFMATGAVRVEPQPSLEPGVTVAIVDVAQLFDAIRAGELDHALHLAVVLLAVLKGGLSAPGA